VNEQEAAERAAQALLEQFPTRSIPTSYHSDKPVPKPRWHFGIRSRSPPMEVMLEIYKTLNVLGMQWKKKDSVMMPEIGGVVQGDGGYPEEVETALDWWRDNKGEDKRDGMGKRQLGKKEIQGLEKAAQGLYHVEVRARYGDTMVSLSHLIIT